MLASIWSQQEIKTKRGWAWYNWCWSFQNGCYNRYSDQLDSIRPCHDGYFCRRFRTAPGLQETRNTSWLVFLNWFLNQIFIFYRCNENGRRLQQSRKNPKGARVVLVGYDFCYLQVKWFNFFSLTFCFSVLFNYINKLLHDLQSEKVDHGQFKTNFSK